LPELYHPYRSASIYVDNNLIGHFGQIHPSVDKKEVYIFELNIEKLLDLKVRTIKFKEINKYPSISRDLAFTMPADLPAKDIMNILKKVGGRFLSSIDIFDVYPIASDNSKSIAYSLVFEDITKTLSDEEIGQIIDKMIKQVEDTLPAKLRSK